MWPLRHFPRELRENRFQPIAEAYFILNNAYKNWRLPVGHFTESPKIAALQCVTIVRYQPFFPLESPVKTADRAAAFPNEIFALSYALGILGVEFKADTLERRDLWLRLIEILSEVQAQTLEPYTKNREFEIIHPIKYYHDLIQTVHRDDRLAINALISVFELMSDKRSKLIGPSEV